jgi:hypothetical protein
MEDEQKKGEGEATEETSSEETDKTEAHEEAEETETEESETETEESSEDIDYEEITELAKGKPKTELEKAKFKRDQIDQRIKELEGGEKKIDLEEVKSEIRREVQEERAQELVSTLTDNPKKQAAILAAWKAGWVRREGTVLDQLLDVEAVIERKRVKKVEELRNLRGEAGKNATTSGGKLPTSQKEPTIAPELRNIMKGSKWDGKKGVWKLPNGTEISPKSLGA